MDKKDAEYRNVELRSEDVQQVMNKISPWILRWGITVLFCVIAALLFGSYLFKYPDTIQAEITLSMENPPAYVQARTAGRVAELFIKNEEIVKQGTPLGIIENAAFTKDVLLLKEKMKEWAEAGYSLETGKVLFTDIRLRLGECQAAYASFISALSDYIRFAEQNYYQRKIFSGEERLRKQQTYYHLASKQYQLQEKEQVLAHKLYQRDSLLYDCNAIVPAEFDQSGKDYLQSLQSREASKMSLTQIAMQIGQDKENLLDVHRQATEEEQKHRIELKNATEQLSVGLTSWEQHYLLVAPVAGKVTLMSVWSSNQYVESNMTVFVVAPFGNSRPMGKALLPLQGSGKVKSGQRVLIRLNNYPDQEFGYISGNVQSVSPLPGADGKYVVEVYLPDGMRTNDGKDLPIVREMKGSADIITEDLRLIERVFMPLKKILKYE